VPNKEAAEALTRFSAGRNTNTIVFHQPARRQWSHVPGNAKMITVLLNCLTHHCRP
jgi:hypothetical protein